MNVGDYTARITGDSGAKGNLSSRRQGKSFGSNQPDSLMTIRIYCIRAYVLYTIGVTKVLIYFYIALPLPLARI